MPIDMRCPGCKTQFEFATELQGKRIKCKTCGDVFRVERPERFATEDVDDRPPVASSRRDRDDDDRPAVGGFSRRRDDDGDRPFSRTRQPADDEERQSARYRRPIIDDEARPSGRQRQPVDDDEDRPRRFREDDEGDQPRKKKSPLLLVLGLVGGVAVVATVVIAILASRGKLGKGSGDVGDVVKAPSKSCPLEVAEKDAGTLVLPDSGNTFGLLRKMDRLKTWTFDVYDMAAGRRVGRIDMSDMDEPRSVSLSPDGKYVLIMEGAGFGISDPTISIWSVAENKPLTARKWNPYPHKGGAFDAPNLYRTEFIGNDKVLTLSAARFMDVWPLPRFDPAVVTGVRIDSKGDNLGRDDRAGQSTNEKYQRQVAFTADHRLMAVWNGNGFTFVNTLDGTDGGATPPVQELVKEIWARESALDRVKGGPVAFSPDGKVLAGILTHVGRREHVLCLWNVVDPKPPAYYEIRSNQFNDAPSLHWWGARYVVTHGARVEGMLIDVRTGLAKRQLMGPAYQHYGFGRDGRLWYAVSDDRNDPARMHVVDSPDPDQLIEPDDYEQIIALNDEFFLRRLWLEPQGLLRKPTRFDPPLQQRLIRRP